MKSLTLFCWFICFSLTGCASTAVITKTENPTTVEATRNYLPPGVMGQPAYTIYEGSKWDCNYKTETNDHVCCSRVPFSTMSPWKYCLILDSELKAFGFFELGTNQYRTWSTGKQDLFKKIGD